MAATILVLGEPVPVTLLLPDGSATKFPRAFAYDPDGNLLATLNLTHRANGFYSSLGFTMPAEDSIVLVFIVYDDAGFLTESVDFLRATDVFVRSAPVALLVTRVTDAWRRLGLDPANDRVDTPTSIRVPADGSLIDVVIDTVGTTVTQNRS